MSACNLHVPHLPLLAMEDLAPQTAHRSHDVLTQGNQIIFCRVFKKTARYDITRSVQQFNHIVMRSLDGSKT
jgi:hypothetical protein